jgi:hypothetical protein
MSTARYENLPVYKKALEVAIHFENVVRGFDQYHKYTVGTDLRNLSRQILMLVAKANIREERKACLAEAIDKLEELKIFLHLCKEIKAFRSFKSFEFASKSVVEVAKQCEGWIRSQSS